MMRRIIVCDVCNKMVTEDNEGEGFPGWGALQGIKLEGVANPNLCPEHLKIVADLVAKLKDEETMT
jgi:hypothetical protein